MSLEDVGGIYGDDAMRISCDAPGCATTVTTRPSVGTRPEGWAEDDRAAPLTTSSLRHYCPTHAALADRPLPTG